MMRKRSLRPQQAINLIERLDNNAEIIFYIRHMLWLFIRAALSVSSMKGYTLLIIWRYKDVDPHLIESVQMRGHKILCIL